MKEVSWLEMDLEARSMAQFHRRPIHIHQVSHIIFTFTINNNICLVTMLHLSYAKLTSRHTIIHKSRVINLSSIQNSSGL